MIFALVVPLAFVLVVVTGGRLERLAALRFARLPFALGALGLQVLAFMVLRTAVPRWVDAVLHVASYVLVAAFAWANRRVPGLPLLSLGLASNGIAIAVNGGQLPARAAALRAAGMGDRASGFVNTGVLAHPRLGWLGDVAATPSWLPLRNVFSVGDVLVALGAAWLIWAACRVPREGPLVAQA